MTKTLILLKIWGSLFKKINILTLCIERLMTFITDPLPVAVCIILEHQSLPVVLCGGTLVL